MENQKTKMTSKEKFIKWRNYQTCQEAIYIACLNEFCEIQLKKPTKKAYVTMQFFQIESLNFSDEDIIQFSKLVQLLVKQRMEYEVSIGVEQKTAARRSENYKFSISLNLLNDLLTEFGYVLRDKIYFNSNPKRNVKKKNESQKESIGETIHFIFKNGKILFDKEKIESIGKNINSYLLNLFNDKNIIVLKRKDSMLNSFVNFSE